MVDSTDAAQFFSAEGVLAQNIAGFKCRPQQVAMAESVERSIQDASTLVIEAGTGVGRPMPTWCQLYSQG